MIFILVAGNCVSGNYPTCLVDYKSKHQSSTIQINFEKRMTVYHKRQKKLEKINLLVY